MKLENIVDLGVISETLVGPECPNESKPAWAARIGHHSRIYVN